MGAWAALIQGALGVDSALQEGQAEVRQAQRNAKRAEEAGIDALVRGQQEAGAMRQAGTLAEARQMTAYSAAGVATDVGTAANVQAATKAQAELEALTIENNAAREAWGFKKHGMDFQVEAGLAASRRARQATGTALSSAGDFGEKWAKEKARGGK